MTDDKMLDYLKKVTAELRDTRKRLAQTQARAREPIAIVGTACRFPGGVTGSEQLWELVRRGGDAMSAFPADRGWDLSWLAETEREPVGGFLAGATDFDAAFFGISPREAFAMDPQQRVALECSWEALEHAGLDVAGLRGSDTGVFVGTNGQDYPELLTGARDGDRAAGHASTGNIAAVLSGRISYVLGLEGPAISVDTACSASLVAIHLGAQALRQSECSLALAGGVTVMSTPGPFLEFARQGVLSGDGRCKAFAEAADGTGWGEGVGILVLERLSDARRLGHRVLALVTGSAINQDGASNGLTAPNGPSQRRVITAALARAGVAPGEVDVVEAHGTGTRLGDPIEAQALLATYGQDRRIPLYLGSVKSNIGHTQAAAGVAGVIKMVEALRRGVLPPTLHVDAPTSQVDWSLGSVRLLTEALDWPALGRPRRAGVSSFGISGTNAHVILEQAAAEPATPDGGGCPPGEQLVPWVVSGADPAAVEANFQRLTTWDADPHAIGGSLATARAQLPHRAVAVGAGRAELAERGTYVTGRARGDGQVGVMFCGQGGQRPGMGAELAQRFSVFADAFDEVLDHLDPAVRAALNDERGELMEFAQPGLFAFQVALYRLLCSWGVTPGVVMGHSNGELASAYVAGVWSLPDACRLVSARGRLIGSAPPGAMVALQGSEQQVRAVLTEGVSVAAVNGPDAVVISGREDEVTAIAERWPAKTTRLRIKAAGHSVLMEPILAEFAEVARSIDYAEPTIPVVSNVTGRLADQLTDPAYWVRHVRETVRFADGVATLLDQGVDAVAEIGPKVTLSSAVSSIAAERDRAVTVAPLGRDEQEVRAALTGAGRLWVDGVDVDWATTFPTAPTRPVELPSYAFQRQRFWPEPRVRPVEEIVDSWRYRYDWVPVATDAVGGPEGGWLVVVDPGRTADADGLLAVLADARVVEAHPDRAVLVERLNEAAAELSGPPRGVASLVGWGPAEQSGSAVDVVWRVVALVQALSDGGWSLPLYCLTRGAVSTGVDEPRSPTATAIWGLARVAAMERAVAGVVVLDLPLAQRSVRWSAAAPVLAGATGGETELALRADGLLGRRLRHDPVERSAGQAGTEPPDLTGATVLVTGGSGGLGTRVARWLLDRHPSRIVLASRSGGVDEELAAEAGERVVGVVCDLADDEAVHRLIGQLGQDDRPLKGVVHVAGAVADVALVETDRSEFDAVAGVKIDGGRALHEATLGMDLPLFVTFSSISAVWGSGGQGAYAAANAYLDGLVAERHNLGLAGTSVSWGGWAGGGMLADERKVRYLAARGLRQMDPELALAALATAIDRGEAHSIVADVDPTKVAALFDTIGLRHLFTELPELASTSGRGAEPGAATASRAITLAGLPIVDGKLRDTPTADQRAALHHALTELVRGCVATVLAMGGAPADADEIPFRDLGFDSLTAVEMRNKLAEATGLWLGSTVVFDHPSTASLVEYLAAELVPGAEDTARTLAAGLDEVEAVLSALPADDLARTSALARMTALVQRSSEPEYERPGVSDRSASAEPAMSDERLFELLDERYGEVDAE